MPFAQPSFITQFLSVQLETFVRQDFGDNYLSDIIIIVVSIWLALLAFTFYAGINIFGYQLVSPSLLTAALFGIFGAAFLLTSVIRKKEIYDWKRDLREHGTPYPVLSWDPGVPRAFWNTIPMTQGWSDPVIKHVMEPLPFLIAGVVFLFISQTQIFGGYILFCTGVMLIKTHSDFRAWNRFRNEVIDNTFIESERARLAGEAQGQLPYMIDYYENRRGRRELNP